MKTKSRKKILVVALLSLVPMVFLPIQASATSTGIQTNGSGVDTLEMIQILLISALTSSTLIMTTCFTRITIVLSFLRNASGLQQTPPDQVLIGMTLFLSLFIMSPVFTQINEDAYQPYKGEQITQGQSVQRTAVPMKEFMFKQTKKGDLNLSLNLSKTEIKLVEEAPLTAAIPMFMTSELRRAFLIGFLIFIPSLIIDMVVSNTLMFMGMIILPPAIISLSFKLPLLVLADGWGLLFKALVAGFSMQRWRHTIRKDSYLMTTLEITGVSQAAILATMKFVLPIPVSSALTGLVIAVSQAVTQIHEQMLPFVPKLLTITAVLILLGPQMIEAMSDFVTYIFSLIASLNQGLFDQ